MMIYGVHTVSEMLGHKPQCVRAFFVLASVQDSSRVAALIKLAQTQSIPVHRLDSATFMKKMKADDVVHQGVCLEIESQQQLKSLTEIVDVWQDKTLLVALDCVQDPHNLGACMRTACAMGAHGLIIPKDKCVQVNETVLKVACGAGAWLPVFAVTNLTKTIQSLQQQGVWCVGSSEHAMRAIAEEDVSDRALLVVVGSEGKGLRRLTQEQCDYLVRLPTMPPIQSLNVSVALGMLLYAITSRR